MCYIFVVVPSFAGLICPLFISFFQGLTVLAATQAFSVSPTFAAIELALLFQVKEDDMLFIYWTWTYFSYVSWLHTRHCPPAEIL